MTKYDDAEDRPALRYETVDWAAPAPDDDQPRRRGGLGAIIFWSAACVVAILAGLAVAALLLATPRAAPEGSGLPGQREASPDDLPGRPGDASSREGPSPGLTGSDGGDPSTSDATTSVPRETSATAGVGLTEIGGTATWYCGHGSPCTRGYGAGDRVAAVDPDLGLRRGSLLTVSSGRRSVVVRVVDVCACAGRRVIDLSSSAFADLSSDQTTAGRRRFLGRGVIPVTITGGATLPPTDLEVTP